MDSEPDDQAGAVAGDHSPHARMPIGTYRKLRRQMIMLTVVVAGLLVFLVDSVVSAVPDRNWLELCAAIPTLLLLLWVLYKTMRGWVVALPAAKPEDAPTSMRPSPGGH